MGEDHEGLRLAYKAGCRGMLIGFESINPETLKDYHKGVNRNSLARYKEMVDNFHRAGIPVFGAFIIGADQDDEEAVAETSLQAVKIGCDTIQITNLTPLPGTKMYERWMTEGKIFATNYPQDWERYTFVETVYNPQRMSAAKLDECIYELRHAAATTAWVWKRTLRTFLMTRSLTGALFIHGMNAGWKRMAKIQLPRDEARFGFLPHVNARTQKLRDVFRLALSKYPALPAPKPEPATVQA